MTDVLSLLKLVFCNVENFDCFAIHFEFMHLLQCCIHWQKMSLPILHSAWFCPFAQRTWIALVHKKVDFVYKEQDLRNKSPELLTINPRGLVPALEIGR